jgi:hypothetical protein
MAQTDFEGFLQAILDRRDLQKRLRTQIDEQGIETSRELADLAVEIGTERGYDFTRETAQLSIDELIAAEQQGAQLANEELERVARAGDDSGPSIDPNITQSFRLDKLKIDE